MVNITVWALTAGNLIVFVGWAISLSLSFNTIFLLNVSIKFFIALSYSGLYFSR